MAEEQVVNPQVAPEETAPEEGVAVSAHIEGGFVVPAHSWDDPDPAWPWFYNQDPRYSQSLIDENRFFQAPAEGPFVHGGKEVTNAVPVAYKGHYRAHVLELHQRLSVNPQVA